MARIATPKLEGHLPSDNSSFSVGNPIAVFKGENI